ncbi:MAG: 6-phosphofructokinase [Candidatus Puniceispirillum sp.]|nr:6-phosphofructokinase [Candidatus Pelagibacter sp.]MBA4283039.1 6-phosphofructokinase [Candidatus Puniceispirillum sp.]
MKKRIGILTSGGDCAGLNAAIRAVYHHATQNYGYEVIGILEGSTGLISRPMKYVVLDQDNCPESIIRVGGTKLGSTNKADPFHYPCEDGTKKDRTDYLIEGYRELNLECLIVIGGDGSLKIMNDIAKIGDLNIVAIPKTIDNDLGKTELAIGYCTALDTATHALDCLDTTAESHRRIMILEVMGRDAGHIALGAGIAGAADVILIPEIPYSLDGVLDRLNKVFATGRKHALVIVAEAITKENGENVAQEVTENGRLRYGGIGFYIADQINEKTSYETRVTVLGHLQRGGVPNAIDRVIASAFGVAAVDLAINKKFGRMVGWSNRGVIDIPIEDAIGTYSRVLKDDVLVQTAKSLGIYIGQL